MKNKIIIILIVGNAILLLANISNNKYVPPVNNNDNISEYEQRIPEWGDAIKNRMYSDIYGNEIEYPISNSVTVTYISAGWPNVQVMQEIEEQLSDNDIQIIWIGRQEPREEIYIYGERNTKYTMLRLNGEEIEDIIGVNINCMIILIIRDNRIVLATTKAIRADEIYAIINGLE